MFPLKRYHSTAMLPIALFVIFFFVFFGNNLKTMITDFAWWLNTIDLCWYNSRFILAFYNLENFNRECSTLFKIHWMSLALSKWGEIVGFGVRLATFEHRCVLSPTALLAHSNKGNRLKPTTTTTTTTTKRMFSLNTNQSVCILPLVLLLLSCFFYVPSLFVSLCFRSH